MKLNISGTELVVLENVETLDTHAVVLKVNLMSRPGFKRIQDIGERCSVHFSLMYQDYILPSALVLAVRRFLPCLFLMLRVLIVCWVPRDQSPTLP